MIDCPICFLGNKKPRKKEGERGEWVKSVGVCRIKNVVFICGIYSRYRHALPQHYLVSSSHFKCTIIPSLLQILKVIVLFLQLQEKYYSADLNSKNKFFVRNRKSIKCFDVILNNMNTSNFIPKPGQVDFTDIRYCPVINCVVRYGEKFLIVERSENLRLYPGYWNGISGFLDDDMSREEKVKDELREELGIGEDDIVSIRFGEIFDQEAPEYGKTWIVHPVLVVVKTDKITLDREAKQYRWIGREDVKNYKLLPGFDEVLERVFRLL